MAKSVNTINQKQHLAYKIQSQEIYKKNMDRYVWLKNTPEKKRHAGASEELEQLKEYFAHYNRGGQVRAASKDEDPRQAGFLNTLWQMVVKRRESFFIAGGKKE